MHHYITKSQRAATSLMSCHYYVKLLLSNNCAILHKTDISLLQLNPATTLQVNKYRTARKKQNETSRKIW